mmetsp:Transcript_48543/g.80487  ORF Transcript_48543/g.80487 Transcript_48543/m.80487 type:complete len:128 (-) Transcript_48543:200-583(-)
MVGTGLSTAAGCCIDDDKDDGNDDACANPAAAETDGNDGENGYILGDDAALDSDTDFDGDNASATCPGAPGPKSTPAADVLCGVPQALHRVDVAAFCNVQMEQIHCALVEVAATEAAPPPPFIGGGG